MIDGSFAVVVYFVCSGKAASICKQLCQRAVPRSVLQMYTPFSLSSSVYQLTSRLSDKDTFTLDTKARLFEKMYELSDWGRLVLLYVE
jgi:hypothetical protein